jgi:hypothetical protein
MSPLSASARQAQVLSGFAFRKTEAAQWKLGFAPLAGDEGISLVNNRFVLNHTFVDRSPPDRGLSTYRI